MKDKLKGMVIAVVAIGALAIGGAAIAGAAGGDDDDATDKPVTGSALSKASAAALEHTGGGTVPRPRPETKRALTRSRSSSRTAARPTCTWTRTSRSSVR